MARIVVICCWVNTPSRSPYGGKNYQGDNGKTGSRKEREPGWRQGTGGVQANEDTTSEGIMVRVRLTQTRDFFVNKSCMMIVLPWSDGSADGNRSQRDNSAKTRWHRTQQRRKCLVCLCSDPMFCLPLVWKWCCHDQHGRIDQWQSPWRFPGHSNS